MAEFRQYAYVGRREMCEDFEWDLLALSHAQARPRFSRTSLLAGMIAAEMLTIEEVDAFAWRRNLCMEQRQLRPVAACEYVVSSRGGRPFGAGGDVTVLSCPACYSGQGLRGWFDLN